MEKMAITAIGMVNFDMFIGGIRLEISQRRRTEYWECKSRKPNRAVSHYIFPGFSFYIFIYFKYEHTLLHNKLEERREDVESTKAERQDQRGLLEWRQRIEEHHRTLPNFVR